ncbi:MAG: MlaD family protein [Planctomycetota bacterium]|jgi:paraquat-inducible protein B
MSTKPNYFKIGIFVIVACTLIFVAIVVFGSGLLSEKKIYYETYFDGSVSGLDIGAPVELRGVRMGQVEKITFAQSEYQLETGSEDYFKYGNYVIVLFSVNVENLPTELTFEQRSRNVEQLTSSGFRLRLASSILTGQAYLQGDYFDPNRYPVLEVPWEPRNFYVSSAPGEFTTIKQSLDRILAKLEQVDTERIGDLIEQMLVSVNQAIDDANIPEISGEIQTLLADADRAINDANLGRISDDIQTFVVNANQAIVDANVAELSNRIQSFIADADQAINDANVGDLSDGIQRLVADADQAIVDANVPAIGNQIRSLFAEARQTNQHLQELLKRPKKTQSEMANIAVTIASLNKTLMRIDKLVLTQSPQIARTLENLREVSADLKQLTGDLKQYPSQLIFSKPPSKSEIVK